MAANIFKIDDPFRLVYFLGYAALSHTTFVLIPFTKGGVLIYLLYHIFSYFITQFLYILVKFYWMSSTSFYHINSSSVYI